jgi:signal transduction histidine kinase
LQKTKVFLREKQEYISIPINPEFADLADDLMLQKWQNMINLVAEILAVKAGLIMRVTEENMEVFLRSENEGNPYPSDGKDHLGHGLYCETVLGENRALYIDNSLRSSTWKDNPDVKLQMISYYGLPIKNPDGSFFGTICALDNKTMADSQKYRDLLDQFRHSIETDLQLVLNVKQMSELLKFLALVTEASSRFVQVRGDISFDQAVKNVLASFGAYFAVDRSNLFLCPEDLSVITASHEWHEPALKEKRGLNEHLPLGSLPWLEAQLLKLQPVEIPEVKALPAEAETEKSYFLAQDIQSLLYLPLRDNQDKLKGFIRFDAIRSLCTWPEEQVKMLYLLAEVVGNALLRIEAENEVYVLNEELEQRVLERTAQLAAANIELEAFAYSVSHDLRAPLRAMGGFSEILHTEYGARLDDQGKHYLERIQVAAIRMGVLIDDLLAMARVTRADFKYEQVDLSKMAAEILAELQAAEPERQVAVEIALGMKARGDKHLLRLAMENLLNNAWKFSSLNGQVRIEVGQTIKEENECIFVRDNGAGFDMDYADKLYKPFQRLHGTAEFPGTGIGLSIVSRVVKRHGGKIWAEGEVGKGATFYFTLP